MKTNRGCWSRVTLALVVVSAPAGLAARGESGQGVCPFEIVGIWKPEVTVEARPVLLSFSTDGWISVLESVAETRAQDFDVTAQVRYRLDASPASTRLVFQTTRGNDAFPEGTSRWEVADYSDASFTTLNRESGALSSWIRVQTHRYFLTFAARSEGGLHRGPAFVMWTSYDGRTSHLEALGVHAGGDGAGQAPAAFGRIPAALAGQLTAERDDDSRVMLRLELSEPEYRRTHAVFADWDQRAETGSLPDVNPYRLVTDFVGAAIDSVNRCGARMERPDAPALATVGADDPGPPQRVLAFIRQLRTSNERQHVPDGAFPFGWEPKAGI